MNSTQRNLMVGIFVLIGLLMLGVLIIMFAEILQFMRPGYIVNVMLPNAMEITPGKMVHKNGIIVGEVAKVEPAPEAAPGVLIKLRIRSDVNIPGDAQLVVSTTSIGDAHLDIPVTAANRGDPVSKDGKAVILGRIEPFSFLPRDVTAKFTSLITNLADLTEPRTIAEVQASDGRLRPNLSTVLQGIDEVINDPENRENIKQGLAKIRDAADELANVLQDVRDTAQQWRATGADVEETSKQIRELTKKVQESADKANQTLEQIAALVTDAREGKGTVGKLFTDDKLYRALWTSAENLTQTLDEAKKLLTLWRTQGVMAKEK